jgi:hypothetical protein
LSEDAESQHSMSSRSLIKRDDPITPSKRETINRSSIRKLPPSIRVGHPDTHYTSVLQAKAQWAFAVEDAWVIRRVGAARGLAGSFVWFGFGFIMRRTPSA